MSATRTLPLLWLVPALLALPACLETTNGRPEMRGPQSVDVDAPAAGEEKPVLWRRVVLGSPPQRRLGGYLRTDLHGSAVGGRLHWVYDHDFRLVGRVSPRGETFRILQDGSERDVGNYDLREALLSVFGYEEDAEVRLERMPPPRES